MNNSNMIVIALILSSLFILGTAAVIFYFLFILFAAMSGGPYVPSKTETVERMITRAKIKPGETFIDLGSGDGRLLIAAAKAGARAVGYEIHPFLVWWSRLRVKRAGLSDRIQILQKSLWEADVSLADVIGVYLVDYRMAALEKKLQKELKPGTRVVSNGFRFPHWQPESENGGVRFYIAN
jgi:SAM-dependent methyltransferase